MIKLPPLSKNTPIVNIPTIKSDHDGHTYFTHVGSARKTLKFKTNHTYSHLDVIELLSKLENLWQESIPTSHVYIS